MKGKPIDLVANVVANLGGGTFFALLSTAAPVTVRLIGQGQRIIHEYEGVQGGLAVTSRNEHGDLEPFQLVEIVSTTNQTIIAASGYGDLTYQRSQGDVNILSLPSVTMTNPTEEIPAGWSVYRRSSASSALATIVTPAANVAGITVYITTLDSGAGGTYSRIMFKTSAPTTWDDSAAGVVDSLGLTGAKTTHNTRAIKLPAGVGLYEQANSAAAASLCECVYKVH